MKRNLTRSITLVSFLLFTTLLAACSPADDGPSLQDTIREYIYKYQPTTGEEFVAWAERNLTDYTPRQVFDALHAEGKFQAKLGHPNSVGVLSFAASAWAERRGLAYDPATWLALQQEAMSNLRDEPGTLQLWPPDQ
jgi:hypothetical protein